MDTNNKDNVIELVNEGILSYIQEDNEFAKDFLIDNDIDMDKERELANRELRKRVALAKATEKQMSDGSLLKQAMQRIREISSSYEGHDSIALQTLLKTSGIGLQFRNIEDWTDEEMREVLSDVDLIKLLSKLKDLDR